MKRFTFFLMQLLLIGCIVGLLGCTAKTESLKPFQQAEFANDADSVIYVFRENIRDDYKNDPFILTVNKSPVGELFIYSYYELHVSEGTYEIGIKHENTSKQLSLEVAVNQFYYLQVAGFKIQEHTNPDLAKGKLAKKMMHEGTYSTEL